jgi:uncharacterized protein YgiB involved in biofilm formation
MLKRLRKSSNRVTLVLIGIAGTGLLGGCQKDEMRRDVYASKQDCLADWGHSPQDCEPAYDRPAGNGARTHYYGRPYFFSGGGSSFFSGGGSSLGSGAHSSRAIGSSGISRGGFGGSGHSASG